MDTEIANRKEIAVEAAKTAGRILMDNFKKPLDIKSKGDRNLFTQIDLKAEDAIVTLIKKNFPEDDILSEENSHPKPGAPFRWIIDPLDGTHNYIHGIDIFGVSIAVEFEKEVIIGVIYMPVADEFYIAQKDKGAYLNDKRLSVSKRTLEQSTLIYDSSIRYNKGPMLKGLEKLVDEVFNIRMFGSSARHLSYIAEGKAEIDIEFNDKVWDFAAGLLLVEEAGGKVTDFKGNKWSTGMRDYIASNGITHEKILGALNG
jgi:myo-inositol-1(or 4)-monophosphatase